MPLVRHWILGMGFALVGCESEPLTPGSARDGCESLLLAPGTCETGPAAPALQRLEQAELPGALAAVFCAAADDCCQQAGRPFDTSACLSETQTQYRGELESFATLAVSYDPEAAADCVRGRQLLLQTCEVIDPSGQPDPCGSVFVGQLLPGVTCREDAECAPIDDIPSVCIAELNSASTETTCKQRTPAEATCRADSCQVGLYCDLFTISCQPLKESGECLLITACGPTTACSPNGQCEPKLSDGEACQLSLQCQSSWCGSTGLCEKPLGSADTCGG